jgi:cytochrome c
MSAITRFTVVAALAAVVSACSHEHASEVTVVNGGNWERGRALIAQYGCGSCHTIPGVRGANAYVAPNLSGIASRSFIAGVISNDPENMVRWLENPPGVDSKTAMPNLGIPERDARDIAAYLYRLKAPGE